MHFLSNVEVAYTKMICKTESSIAIFDVTNAFPETKDSRRIVHRIDG